MQKKVIVITGSSRGIGKAAAIALAKQGHKVYATMRNPAMAKFPDTPVHVIPLDVASTESTENAIQHVIHKEKQIDVLINNAGYGLFGPVELATEDEVLNQFNVNVFGVIRTIQAVAPHMRRQKSGLIMNISSIAGFMSNPGVGIYAATKHAVEALSSSLAITLHPWNIKVVVVEPGPVATEFAESMTLESGLEKESPYHQFMAHMHEYLSKRLDEGQSPEEVADMIVQIVESENPHFRYQTSREMEKLANQFLKDPSGDHFIEEQVSALGNWFKSVSN